MSSLEIVLGLVLVILFYSLLATIIMELISGFASMRGKHLERVLRSLLSSGDRKEEIFEDFKKSALYQQLAGRPVGKKTPPSYIESSTFRTILTKVVAQREGGGSFKDKIDRLPDNDLKELLTQFWDESEDKFHYFAEKVESWYDDVMERASGWYQRQTQKILLVLGLAIAVIFNVDTITVYDRLANSSRVDMEQLISLAETVDRQNNGMNDNVSRETYEFIQGEFASLKDPLGIGWENVSLTNDVFFWLLKIFGWIVTAICISKGAPFWFDLLRKVVNFRDTGGIKEKPTPSPLPVAPPLEHNNRPPLNRGMADEREMIEKPVG